MTTTAAPWSLVKHPEWAEIRKWLRVERYDRDTNQHGHVRHRIEVITPERPSVRAWLLNVSWYCVRCGVPVKRIRERDQWGTLYFAAGHPLGENVACSRGRDAADEYRLIAEDLAADPIVAQPPLPFGR